MKCAAGLISVLMSFSLGATAGETSASHARESAQEVLERTEFFAEQIRTIRKEQDKEVLVAAISVPQRLLERAANEFDSRHHADLAKLRETDGAAGSEFATYSDCSSAARELARYAYAVSLTGNPYAGSSHLAMSIAEQHDCRRSLGMPDPGQEIRSPLQMALVALTVFKNAEETLLQFLAPDVVLAAMSDADQMMALAWVLDMEVSSPVNGTLQIAWNKIGAADDKSTFKDLSACWTTGEELSQVATGLRGQIDQKAAPVLIPAQLDVYRVTFAQCEAAINDLEKNAL